MIKTVADLLEQLREKEAGILAKQAVKHGPTIGSMYEGLTKDVLGRAIPPNLGLAVTSGFVVDSCGNRSKQADCMVTCGPGEGIPYTDGADVHIDDVVAVIEVKKNLYSSDLESGYWNLASLRVLDTDGSSRSIHLLRDAFQSITRHAYPEDKEQLEAYSDQIQMIFHALAVDLMYPARIIFGYNGFASENSLRESFARLLDRGIPDNPAKRLSPARLPVLICCGSRILFKANGMPFHAPLQDDGFWPIYSSTTINPLEMLLEVVWTRLSYEGRLSGEVFEGSDVAVAAHRFLDVHPLKLPTSWGWEYRYCGKLPKRLDGLRNEVRWEPTLIDHVQQAILLRAQEDGFVDLSAEDNVSYLNDNGYTPETMTESLNALGLAARVGDHLRLLKEDCAIVMMPDGRIAVGEDSSGQLTNWIMEEEAKRKGTA